MADGRPGKNERKIAVGGTVFFTLLNIKYFMMETILSRYHNYPPPPYFSQLHPSFVWKKKRGEKKTSGGVRIFVGETEMLLWL